MPRMTVLAPAMLAAGLALAGCSSGDDTETAEAVEVTEIADVGEVDQPAGLRTSSAFQVCNLTASTVGVAVGYRDGETMVTEGWWTLPPQRGETPSCVTPAAITAPLQERYYYVYAVDYTIGGEWTGDYFMCTSDREFTIRGIEDCVARGYDRTGFVEIDTGDRPTYIVRLTDQQGIGGR